MTLQHCEKAAQHDKLKTSNSSSQTPSAVTSGVSPTAAACRKEPHVTSPAAAATGVKQQQQQPQPPSVTSSASVAAQTSPEQLQRQTSAPDMGTKDVDEILKFINGGVEDEADKKSSKAAKRARQKQRKVRVSQSGTLGSAPLTCHNCCNYCTVLRYSVFIV